MRLRLHLLVLPRWFGAPAALSGVFLGPALLGHWSWNIILVAASALCLMAYSHSANSWLDWSWTGLDKGESGERSQPKPYTIGQSVIGLTAMAPTEVAVGTFGWLGLSAGFAALASWWGSPWVWLPWALLVPMTFWYSRAKLLWHPELPLCLGFGPVAVWLGMSAVGRPEFLTGLLAAIPLMLLWAAAEQVDQAVDYGPNWPKGARSSGMWWRHRGYSLGALVSLMVGATYAAQLFLMQASILALPTLMTAVAAFPLFVCINLIDKKERAGIVWGLSGITLYQGLLVAGQVIGR